MSEMDTLKENTEKSAAIQKMESISKYLDVLIAKCVDAAYWNFRGSVLQLISIVAYWVTSFLVNFLNIPDDQKWWFIGLSFVVLLVTWYRELVLERDYAKAEKEWDGAIHILQLLGMVKPPRPRGNRSKRKIWKEGVDLVKMWAVSKKKMQEKVYAPA